VYLTVTCELLAAGLLLAPRTLRIGSALGAALIVTVTVLAAIAVARGRRPTCACFGQRDARLIGAGTFVRNFVLLALAASTLVASAPRFWWEGVATISLTSIAVICAFGLVALVLFWIVAELMRQQGRLLLRIEALERQAANRRDASLTPERLPAPRELPDVLVVDESGLERKVAEMQLPGEPTLLVFTDEDCTTCQTLLPGLLASMGDGSLGVDVALVSRQVVSHSPARVFADPGGAAADAFGIVGVPSAVFVDSAGRMPYAVAAGPPAISALLAACRDHARTPLAAYGPSDPFVAPALSVR
jgi:hypothetical protein